MEGGTSLGPHYWIRLQMPQDQIQGQEARPDHETKLGDFVTSMHSFYTPAEPLQLQERSIGGCC